MIRRSSPRSFCNSPNANINPNRAFPIAIVRASPVEIFLNSTDAKLSIPTARIVINTISEIVTTNAKPAFRAPPSRLLGLPETIDFLDRIVPKKFISQKLQWPYIQSRKRIH